MYENIQVEFDEKTLSDVARIAERSFFPRRQQPRRWRTFTRRSTSWKNRTVKVSKYREYRDLFQWFVGTSALCLGGYLMLSQLLWRRLP